MDLPLLRLKNNEHRRLTAGHLWVYSNEVDTAQTPLTGFEPGEAVAIQAADGRPLGSGYVNPHSLICARLVSRDPAHVLGRSLLIHRLNVALALRQRLYEAPYYRLVYGEADALPGLVVDRYGDVLVVQITTAGMERVREEVVAALEKVLRPSAILLKNDAGVRELEGLPAYVEAALGEVPEQAVVPEGPGRFQVSLSGGQKTGWFYDQRPNRLRLGAHAKGMRVLDMFSYVGAWGVHAALAGAAEVRCVDASAQAVALVRDNAERNGVAGQVSALQGDALDVLKSLRAERERFDVVVLDPPAFVPRKKDLKEGLQAYRRLNQMAMQVMTRDAILVSASCSYHLRREDLVGVLNAASRHVDRSLQVLEQGHQGPDHPLHPAIPETEYLKTYFCRVLR
jgi:23S rRNA (cytosine1962-C5)-methyltransferase